MKKITKEEALLYHNGDRPGKIEITPTKPCTTQRDLSMAYTPGVAEACLEIYRDNNNVFKYTTKGNLVAVVTNGTAVLGLGNIGPIAGKPVMEGKGVLFKRFADVDVFDIEVNSENPDDIIKVCQLIEPTFGGINLEDIKAPDCFYIEEKLKEILNIPVFHDDQHGTAIITTAAIINALEIQNKKIEDVKIVINGAGAAGIAIAKMLLIVGASKNNITLCDSKGIVYKGRKEGMNKYKEEFAIETNKKTLGEALNGADMFIGVSVKGAVTKEMVKEMAEKPIIMAMANPEPEITPEEVAEVRDDVLMATGRSDYPNQVNNVLGFPFIFRGALDVKAKAINDEMKLAAAKALAQLAKEDVPENVCRAYGIKRIDFGKDYIIPKPFDPRVLTYVAPAVAKAAIETGVAREKITDFNLYKHKLESRLSIEKDFIRMVINIAKDKPKRLVFPEGEYENIIRAASHIVYEGFAKPILIGDEQKIISIANKNKINLEGIEIIFPEKYSKFNQYAEQLYQLRQRKGVTLIEAERRLIRLTNYFAAMMVLNGDADCAVSGYSRSYPESIVPFLETIPFEDGYTTISGSYFIIFKKKIIVCSDTTVNIDPDAEKLSEIAIQAAELCNKFNIAPKIALLSFSNFGSVRIPNTNKVKDALKLVKSKRPDLIIDGEMQADTATYPPISMEAFPFSDIKGDANVLIFPNLDAGNIAYKLLYRLGNGTAIGPILQGFKKSVHALQRGSDVNEIVYLSAIAVSDAINKEQK
jgi:malate dehydrogenase (oxaloacetate-decarboxylating)(NADP+)